MIDTEIVTLIYNMDRIWTSCEQALGNHRSVWANGKDCLTTSLAGRWGRKVVRTRTDVGTSSYESLLLKHARVVNRGGWGKRSNKSNFQEKCNGF